MSDAASNSASRRGVRVLYLLPQPFFEPRGSSFRALATVKAFRDLGMEVDLLCYPFGEAVTEPGVRVLRSGRVPGVRAVPIGPSPSKILLDIPYFFAVAWRMLRRRYDAVHGVEEAGLIAYLLTRVMRRPYVFDMHSWMSAQLRDAGFSRLRWLFRRFEKLESRALRKAFAVITVGDSISDEIRTRYPSLPCYTLNDFALAPPPASEDQARAFRERWIPQGRAAVLYTGNFEPYQGLDLLLEAMRELVKTSDRPPYLLMVGGGTPEHPRVIQYAQRIREMGLDAHVGMAGSFPWQDMGAFTAMADALVSPRTQGANTPLKVYSYMSSGRVIVATRVLSHTQVLNDGNAMLADPNPASLAIAILEAVRQDPDAKARRARLIAAAQADIARSYNANVFRERLAECYSHRPGASAV